MEKSEGFATRQDQELQLIDLGNVELDALDGLGEGAVRDALEAVARRGALPSDHRDHGSHSNTPD
jgi:hypothetical protein